MKLQTFVAVREILVVKVIVPVVEGLNTISLYAIYDLGPELQCLLKVKEDLS